MKDLLDIWCISKYALPPEYGAQHRLFKLAEWFNYFGSRSLVITSSTNHLTESTAKNTQREIFKSSVENNVNTLFIKGIDINNSKSFSRLISWFVFEARLFIFILKHKKFGYQTPDVVLVSSLSLFTVLNGLLLKVLYRTTLVFEVRDIWPLTAILITGKSKFHPLMILMRVVEKIGYRYADLISSPLPNLSEHVKESIGSKFRFLYVPQGYDAQSNTQEKLEPEFIEKFIPEKKFIIAYIGNIVSAYDLDTLIEVARKTCYVNSKIHFLILGDGQYKQNLIEKSYDLNNVTFIPRIPKSKVGDFLSYCDLVTNFLKPELLFRYGVAPQKIVDYFLAKKPVLMSYTGYPSLVREAGAGFEIEAGNVDLLHAKILEIYNLDKAGLKELGENGYRYLTVNLSWKNLAEKYLLSFHEIIRLNRSRR